MAVVIGLALALLLALMSSGCTTVTPKIVESPGASWDGTNQNNGFLGWTTNGCGRLTPHARARYNGLIEVYGQKFLPPLTADYGITPGDAGEFIFTPEALADFVRMNRWRKVDAVKN